ncbi:MAG: ABC transporter permease [Vicinamibacterales bacterium]|jgi:putative ABC transport system permease protein|nr:ABC transporter permease [Vicinamibacterales bacterium]
MRFFPLIWSSLFRRKVRTLFTLLSIVIAFVLFNYLSAVRVAFSMGVDVAGNDRLMLIHKVSFIQLLPESYQARILSVDGVKAVTHSTWFGGVYQDPRNFFGQFAVEPEGYLNMYPEFLLPDDAKERWYRNRTGAVVGRSLADRFDWTVGDRIPLQGTIWRTQNGDTWEFTIDGIYDGAEQGTDTSQFLFHYDYLAEANALGRGFVGWYMIQIDDPSRAVAIGDTIDERFANSPFETATSTEQAFVQAFASQIGDIGSMMTAIMGAVLFTILLVSANTMGQSVRERTSELAVLKTLGFTNRGVLSLVLVESLLMAVVGGSLGMGLSWLIIQQGDPTGGLLPAFFVPPRDLVIGAGLILFLGTASGVVPGVQAVRLRIVDALRRT